MTKYRIDVIGQIGMFKEFNDIEMVNSAQTFEVNLNTKNIDANTELSLLTTEAKSRLEDYICGERTDFCITKIGIVDTVIKDWTFEESEDIFFDCMSEEFEYSEDY